MQEMTVTIAAHKTSPTASACFSHAQHARICLAALSHNAVVMVRVAESAAMQMWFGYCLRSVACSSRSWPLANGLCRNGGVM